MTVLLDTGAEVNVVDPMKAAEWLLAKKEGPTPKVKWGSGREAYCYGAYELSIAIKDSTGFEKQGTITVYALDKHGISDVIFGMPALRGWRIELYTADRRWRFACEATTITHVWADELAVEAEEASVICEIRLADINPPDNLSEDDLDDQVEVVLPEEFRDFEVQFSDQPALLAPPNRSTDHAIETTADPPWGPLYHLSVKELQVLKEYLEEAQRNGWIRPSKSPASAPILFVPKKDGTQRLCVDYRALNKVTIKNRYPIPLISEILDRLSGAKVFTKLDLKNAYHRIRIKAGDEWKTAFRTRYGHFEYLVMPFGLANAPATFQSYINKALAEYVDVICIVYMDDILIYSDDRETHVRDVCAVLARLKAFDLYCNLKKCKFFVNEVDFLGFIVGTQGIRMDPARVETIQRWPVPTEYTHIQIFLGFCNFYRRFIEAYSRISAPLNALLKGSKNGKKEGPFEWPDDAAHAFTMLRDAFLKAPILRHFDPSLKIRMETDASGFAAAAILSQLQLTGSWHPVAYWSKKLSGSELNWKTYDQELFAIVAGFKQWRPYLEGSRYPIEVLTDHNNLVGWSDVKQLNGRQARWAMLLACYDFIIQHRPGKTNPADAPSRRPDYAEETQKQNELLPTLQKKLAVLPREHVVAAIEIWQSEQAAETASLHSILDISESMNSLMLSHSRRSVGEGETPSIPRILAIKGLQDEKAYGNVSSIPDLIRVLQASDTLTQRKRRDVTSSPEVGGSWSISSQGLMLFKSKVFVPEDHAVRSELLKRYHDDPFAGHFGAGRTLELIKRKYYWPKMERHVDEYVQSCEICQKTKVKRHAPYGQLNSLPYPESPWSEITMDFMSGIPPSMRRGRAYNAILVVIDRYTKMALYIPVTKDITAPELADLMIDEVFTRFGVPKGIVSDRDPKFTSQFWSACCYHAAIKRRLSTAFHPQTDGQTERQNQIVQEYLRAFCSEEQAAWARILPIAEFAYNNSKHSTTGLSPFFAMYGYNPQTVFDVEDNITKERVPAAKERIERLYKAREKLEERWQKAATSQAVQYNKKHQAMLFNKGDLVLISTKNLKLKTPSRKMSQRYMGPFRIAEPIGTQAYRIHLPSQLRIHNVFHVSLLEKYTERVEPGEEPALLPLPEIVDGEEEWELEEILDKRKVKGNAWYLVKWVGYSDDYNQWLPAEDLNNAKELRDAYEVKHNSSQRRSARNKS